ncbi:MAG TPA: BACON domain-containing carbohydrate-binding protein [Bryobacteraceae bacterium]|nr:BACON domain-containing carbohydrate-binding protein [Bryobacteraceae bacterium]
MVALGSERCQVEVYPATGQFDLLDGRQARRSRVAAIGSLAKLSGAECSISATSVAAAGDELSINVEASIPRPLDAGRSLSAIALTKNGAALTPVSLWTDPAPAITSTLDSATAQTSSGCPYTFPNFSTSFGQFGLGASTILLVWTTNLGCQGSATGSGPWFTLGAPGAAGIYNFIPITVSANNTHQPRYGSITFTGTNFSQLFNVNQVSGADLVSVLPLSGTGSSQVFSVTEFTAGTYGLVLDLQFQGADTSTCILRLVPGWSGNPPYALLGLDSGFFSGPLNLPSVENLQNSVCTLNGALSGVSSSGDEITFQLAMDFSQGFAGPRYLSASEELGVEVPSIYATWVVPVDPGTPALRIVSSHTGFFTQGLPDSYSLAVSNYPGAAATSGTVTVTDALPQGIALVSMSGDGWTCTGSSCTRADLLPAGGIYPPITVNVTVGATFLGGANEATVSGGGAVAFTVSDYTFYTANDPQLSVTSSHSGNFTQAQANAGYTITVSNQAGAVATSAAVNVTDTLPYGLSFVSIVGDGWSCSATSPACSRNDALNPGESYPPLTLAVKVSPTASSPLVNSISVTSDGTGGAVANDSTVIDPHGPVTTIQSSVTGAPFSLEDGTVYQSPYTFYWLTGEQHTVTWLTSSPASPGSLYAFQSWSDGGSNPRTFTAASTATYTATVGAQYLLTVNIPFSGGSTVAVSPSSIDGYYPAGTIVTLTATNAPGISVAGFSGTSYTSNPYTVTMNAPYTANVGFYCSNTFAAKPKSTGPGPLQGVIAWAANSACPVPPFNGLPSWFSLGQPSVFAGYNVIPYSIPENTGVSDLTAQVTTPSGYFSFAQFSALDDASQSNVVSVTPSIGTGSSQVFTFQVFNWNGYSQINAVVLSFGLTCRVTVSGFNGSPVLSLPSDTGDFQQLTLPGFGTMQNSSCAVDAASSSISGSGDFATVQLGMSFQTVMESSQFIYDASQGMQPIGLWAVGPDSTVPALSATEVYGTYGLNPGQTNVRFTATVTNSPGAADTSGTVTLTQTVPAGLSVASMSGTGWNCPANTCTRGDPLSGGSSYPPILVYANVAADATGTQNAVVTASGGGSASFTGFDPAYINGPPNLSIQSSHTGAFAIGQSDASYNIIVTNHYVSLPTSGTVTVTENLPTGLTLESLSGTGWNCNGSSCTRSDSLSAGGSYPALTATVLVAMDATSPLVNQVAVSGGGSANASASDSTAIITSPPILSVSITDNGPFYSAEDGAAFTVIVSNQAGSPATTGTLTVSAAPPTGLQILSMGGDGWTCTVSPSYPPSTGSCSRSDALGGGHGYPPIAIGIYVYGATSPLVTQVRVSGGSAANLTASDPTVILAPASLSVSLTDSGNFTQGENNATYMLTISNKAGVAPSLPGTTTSFSDYLPAGLTLVSISGTGWNCSTYTLGYCSRSDSLAAGSSFPPVTITVNITATVSSPLVNSISVTGPSYITATDTTVVLPHSAAITIQAGVTGVPFALDNAATYQAPVTFYWPAGQQHTVTWLSAAPGQAGARYAFQNWADGGANPRTFTGGTAGTYTANVSAQYLLTIDLNPAAYGSVTASPVTADGYYNAGQTVVITPIPNQGFAVSGVLNQPGQFTSLQPYAVLMNAPQTVTAYFACQFTKYGPFINGSSPGPFHALLLWTSGLGCTVTETTAPGWLTVGTSYSSDGFNAIPFSAPTENRGSELYQEVLSSETASYSVTQGAEGNGIPGTVSLAPQHGSGSAQVFALQAYHEAGYTNIGELDLTFTGADGSQCHAVMSSFQGQGSLYLSGALGSLTGPLYLPGSGVLQNNLCTLRAAGSSFAGAESYVTAFFDLTFASAFAGSKYVTATATDMTGTQSETNVLGTWRVSSLPGIPVGPSPADLSIDVSASPNLNWVASGASSYDIYLGTSLTPPLVGNVSINSYSPPTLNPGSTYYWQVVAKNSAGSNASAVWSFTTAQSCSAPVTASNPYTVASTGGGASVQVGAANGCSWGYTGPVSWITLQPPSGLGSGEGSVTFTVAPNDTTAQRSASITVAGVSLSIAQAANLTCDVSGDGQPGVADVQEMVNEALGTAAPLHALSGNNTVTVADIQVVLTAVLSSVCSASGN